MPNRQVVGKFVARLEMHEPGIVFPERVVGLEPHAAGVAHLLAVELTLYERKDSLVAAVQVFDGRLGLFDQRAVGIMQHVGEGDDGIFAYRHFLTSLSRPSTSAA